MQSLLQCPFNFKVCQPSVKTLAPLVHSSSLVCLYGGLATTMKEGLYTTSRKHGLNQNTKPLVGPPQIKAGRSDLFASKTSVILQESGKWLVKKNGTQKQRGNHDRRWSRSNPGEPNRAEASITQKHVQGGKKQQDYNPWLKFNFSVFNYAPTCYPRRTRFGGMQVKKLPRMPTYTNPGTPNTLLKTII